MLQRKVHPILGGPVAMENRREINKARHGVRLTSYPRTEENGNHSSTTYVQEWMTGFKKNCSYVGLDVLILKFCLP